MTKTVWRRKACASVLRLTALLLALCLLPLGAAAESSSRDGWVEFILICNEGMNNNRGNAGNTTMIVALNTQTGMVKMLMFTWDTFIDYEGYDVPQRLDMPYRNNGPEELVRVFNQNFNTGITRFMSLNYLNLASLIDAYGGVTVDITRAERNALNGMVGSKRNQLQQLAGSGLITQVVLDSLASNYYLNDYGPDTELNGLQAVGYGWLQYDSVYNCCEREIEVVAALFHSVGTSIGEHVAFYTDATGAPEDQDGKRLINLDFMTKDDREYLMREMSPIFDMSYNNLSDEEIETISWGLARGAYLASRQGVNVFDHIDTMILPEEARDPYDNIAGAQGHLVNKESNAAAIRRFIYGEE